MNEMEEMRAYIVTLKNIIRTQRLQIATLTQNSLLHPSAARPPGIAETAAMLADKKLVSKKRQLDNAEGDEPSAKRVRAHSSGQLVIYTDGSALNNGRPNARAGFGLVASDGQRVHGKVTGKQTNQRAELTAVYYALRTAAMHPDVLIRTDSKYAMQGIDEWSKTWLRNGWKTAKGKPVLNEDIWKPILKLRSKRDKAGVKTSFQHVKAHAGDPGNEEADALAKQAAAMQ